MTPYQHAKVLEALGRASENLPEISKVRELCEEALSIMRAVQVGWQKPEAVGVPLRPPMHFCRPHGLRYELPPLVITGHQLREALDFLDADGSPDQLDFEVSIALRDEGKDMDGEQSPRGMYCWLTDHPEEGSIQLKRDAHATPPEPSEVKP